MCSCGGRLGSEDTVLHTPVGREVSPLKVKHVSAQGSERMKGICCFLVANLNAYETSGLIGSYLETRPVGTEGL